MSTILGLGKYMFALIIAVFGLFHFMNGPAMAGMVPIPGGVVWVYLSGAGLIAAALSIVLGKYDKLGTTLLGFMLLIFALGVHLRGMMGTEDAMAQQSYMGNLLKDIGLAGAAWMYAGGFAKDKSLIG